MIQDKKTIKKCNKCGCAKELSGFYKDNQNSDGIRSICKMCCRLYCEANKEKIASKKSDYSKSEKGKEVQRIASANYRIKNPHKTYAISCVNTAIKNGKLIKGKCVVCDNKKTEAHHPDYLRPLYVVWLCQKHHKRLHKKLRS